MAKLNRKNIVVARRGRVATVDPKLAKELQDVSLTDPDEGALITVFGDVPKARQATMRAKIVAAWKQRADVPKDEKGNPTVTVSIQWTPGETGKPQVFANVGE